MDNTKDVIPKHVAIIMDGNGRWAKERGLERIEGHYSGVDSVREVIKAAIDIGVKYLSIYAFSKENWGRPTDEVIGLMELFCKTIEMELPSLNEQKVKTVFLTEQDRLSDEVLKTIDLCESSTKDNTNLTLIVALNYGSRSEITIATKEIAKEVLSGTLSIDDIDETCVSNHLFTKNIPDPDLLIRTSGELRLSNFLLWQLSYSEFYFTDIYWPDFKAEEFGKAISSYTERLRRYGKTTSQIADNQTIK